MKGTFLVEYGGQGESWCLRIPWTASAEASPSFSSHVDLKTGRVQAPASACRMSGRSSSRSSRGEGGSPSAAVATPIERTGRDSNMGASSNDGGRSGSPCAAVVMAGKIWGAGSGGR